MTPATDTRGKKTDIEIVPRNTLHGCISVTSHIYFGLMEIYVGRGFPDAPQGRYLRHNRRVKDAAPYIE